MFFMEKLTAMEEAAHAVQRAGTAAESRAQSTGVAEPGPAAGDTADGSEPPGVRTVNNVAALKAMADPTRFAILTALMRTSDLPVMSVKELAAELGEPQTKLYRHVRQLEEAGLIRVASTRMVSGILEQRYQACQRDLTFGRGLVPENADDSERVLRTVLDRHRDGLFAAARAGRLAWGDVPAGEPYRKPLLHMSDLKVSPAKAAEVRDKIEEILSFLKDAEAEDGVTLNMLISFYVPTDPDPG
jgi:DNA-binding transcriptional ArsR family regulator